MSRPHADADRGRLRAQIAGAARILAPTWPLRTFVAVNPLGGLEDRSFEQAVAVAAEALGVRGHLPPAVFRAEHKRGRITDADLDAALRRRIPELDDLDPVHLGPRTATALEVLRTDLLHGPEAASPPARPHGTAEWCDALLHTRLAAAIDEQVTKWCAAFCDEHHAHWSMPGREHGLYAAWRALIADDPALRRLGLPRRAFVELPERPEDAVLDALDILRLSSGERPAELRGQLARLPGWAAHLKWRGEHPDQAPHPADLTDLLAVRLTLEAHAVRRAAEGVLAQGVAGLRALIRTERHGAGDGPARTPAVAAALGGTHHGQDELDAILQRLPARDRAWVWLDAYEWHYRDRLLARLSRSTPVPRTGRPAAQAVFCIDARSEGLRRHLEAQGAYETFGFAGFYQLVVRYRSLAATHEARLCPVPVTPTKTVAELPAAGTEAAAARAMAAARHADALVEAFHDAKNHLASPFALAEAAGWVAGPLAMAKTAAPARFGALRARLARRATSRATALTVTTPSTAEAAEMLVAQAERQGIRAVLARPGLTEEDCEARRLRALAGEDPALAARLDLTAAEHTARVRRALRLGYDLDEQVFWADFALRSFGLIDGFAPLVLLVGHGSRTENNAYEASLDCGACGGQPGGPNARMACAVLNRPAVRAGLAERGIRIPEDTVFVAGEHDTATDRVTVHEDAIPGGHAAAIAQLRSDLRAAGAALARERAARLPGRDHPDRRASDWAQIRPEWGLARHGAFIIGPGDVVSGADLECRTFLHSYDWRADPDGRVLETILTAPGLVVQWINAQYYFSAVDPEVLGAGDKTLHNVVGDVGVLQGHGGDLRLGLPWQSVAAGDQLYHEPMRALYVVQAPRERVEALIARNDLLRHFFDGEWVALVVREAAGEPWQRRTTAGAWVRWTPAEPKTLKPTLTEVAA